ncbi:MAG: sigma-54-dependent Fis family transcriptional regulator [Alphaproteobacteria bacterium]|nr:sigma-54-dependent Fis family transcriptional regulator [Alphaproteobacteria bacterium]
MAEKHSILLVEDTPALARTYMGFLFGEAYDVHHVETGEEALQFIDSAPAPAAILLDLKLPGMDGLEVLQTLQKQEVSSPVIVITAQGSINTAVDTMRAGAFDFLVKPFSADRLKVTLRNACEKQELRKIVDTYQSEIDRHHFAGFIGSSLIMQSLYRIIEAAAASDATVFITGESGTGKELCARAIHQLSKRGDHNLVPLNCAAIPKDLIESELFGHKKGAFTGAVADRMGAAGMADEGTLFLDEICETDPSLQVKLLRFVQTSNFMRLGDAVERKVSVRFICATNRDPAAEVSLGNFREDLFFRLHVIPIHLPALRERGEDVLEIASHLLAEYCESEGKHFQRLSPEVAEMFLAHDWPGNVRQLENVIRNAVVLNDGEELTPDMLNERFREGSKQGRAAPLQAPAPADETPIPVQSQAKPEIAELAKLIRPIKEIERAEIERAVSLCDGDVRKAALFLGIAPATIYRRQKDWQDGV